MSRITRSMTVALLGIGTELSRGDLVNTNGTWLARELTERGFEVAAIDVVDDEPARIVAALRRLGEAHELVICTGGLGPTTDDLTTASAAEAIGTDLILHEPSVQAIADRLAKYGRTLSESNKKQAYFPRGAEILANDWGTAPGFSVQIGRASCFFLPGVPTEMMELFRHRVLPQLDLPRERTPVEVLLRTYGLPESALNDRLEGIADEHQVVIGYRVRFPEIDLKVHARSADSAVANARAEAGARAIVERLGPTVYGRGDVTLAGVVGETIRSSNLNLGVAESCTGGLIASLVTSEAGSSRWFKGGVVAYANQVKTDLLDVPTALIEAKGAVSVEVAEAMALGVARALGTEIGVATTGIAGPDGGSAEKPVGTVCFGIHSPAGTRSQLRCFHGDRQRIQRAAAFYALSMVLSDPTLAIAR